MKAVTKASHFLCRVSAQDQAEGTSPDTQAEIVQSLLACFCGDMLTATTICKLVPSQEV